MGFDGRYGGDRSRDVEEIESLAAFHGIDVEVAADVLALARREAALDDYRRPPREWFRMVLERRRSQAERVPGSAPVSRRHCLVGACATTRSWRLVGAR
jgi:hypothetical protein